MAAEDGRGEFFSLAGWCIRCLDPLHRPEHFPAVRWLNGSLKRGTIPGVGDDIFQGSKGANINNNPGASLRDHSPWSSHPFWPEWTHGSSKTASH